MPKQSEAQVMDPYRLFFPAGALAALVGTILWPLFLHQQLETYPASVHSDLMVGGFLFCFVLGFLMTAVPKFTGSFAARAYELRLALFVETLFLIFTALHLRTYAYAMLLAQFIILIRFAILRFRSRQHNPPPSFVFVGFGILCGLTGVILMLISLVNLAPQLETLAKLLFYQGFILSLIIGVGARLITALLGWAPSPLVQIKLEKKAPPLTSEKNYFLLLLVTLVVSLALEGTGYVQAGRLIRLLLILTVSCRNWKLHKLPKSPGNLARCLWVAAWCLLLGVALSAILPDWGVHGLHMIFIGGFGLITLLIASRVTFAHGGFPMDSELKSKAVWVVTIAAICAALSRIGAAISQTTFNLHLEFAAYFWLIGVGAWAIYFIPKMIWLHRANVEHEGENC